MLEVISKNSKYITLRMPIRLSRSIFGELIKNEQSINKTGVIVSEDYVEKEDEKIFKRYRNIETSKLKDVSVLYKKYNFK